MSWTCACDTQNLDAARYCELCGLERRPTASPVVPPARPHGTQWSPPVPTFTEETWRGETRMTPEAVEPYLAELRKTAEARMPDRTRITAEQTAAYLAACRAKGYSTAPLEALEPITEPAPQPRITKPLTPARRAAKRALALMFPVTEAEELAARQVHESP